MENDLSIFKFLNPKANDMLSSLSEKDLDECIRLLNKYYLEYREALGFEKYITFGVEIEFETAMRERIESKLIEAFDNNLWHTKLEYAMYMGAEVATPILIDTKSTWRDVSKACNVIREYGYEEDEDYRIHQTSGHVHVGAHVLGNNPIYWKNLISLWATYENVIYRFGYGEYLRERRTAAYHAMPASFRFHTINMIGENESSVKRVIKNYSLGKSYGINFLHVNIPVTDEMKRGSTIEFRCPNGTLNTIVIQNNVNFFVNLLLACKREVDLERLESIRNSIKDNLGYLGEYKKIDLESALELADTVFTNNFDKIYFLRQYIKNYQTSIYCPHTGKGFAKKFTV